MGYVLAVRANHTLTASSGRAMTAAQAARLIPRDAWHRIRTGYGSKGLRHYDWAMLEVTGNDTAGDGCDDGHSVLLVRRHRYTGTLSFYRCWTPGPVPPSRLIAIAVTRWRSDARHRHPAASPRPRPPPALVAVATPPPVSSQPSPLALECLRRCRTVITTNYSCLIKRWVHPCLKSSESVRLFAVTRPSALESVCPCSAPCDLLAELENSFLDPTTSKAAKMPRTGVHVKSPHG